MRIRASVSTLELRLLSGAAWSLVGAGITRALLLGASVAAGRILGVVEFGKLGMVQSTTALFGALCGAGLSLAATRIVAQKRASEPALAGGVIAKAYRLALASGAVGALLVFSLARGAAGRPDWLMTAFLPELRVAAPLVLFGALNAVQTAVLAGLDGFRVLAMTSILRGGISCLSIALGARHDGLRGAVAGQVIAEALSAAVFHLAIVSTARSQRIELSPAAAPRSISALAGIALPTLLGALALHPIFWLCNVLLANGPNGFADLGIFNAADRWRQVLLFLPASLSANVLSALSQLDGAGDRATYRRVFRHSVGLALLAVLVPGVAFALLAPLCLGVFGAEYQGGALTLIILVGSCIPVAINNSLGQVLVTRGLAWWRFFVDVGLGAVLLLTAFTLIPRVGAPGLALAHLLAFTGAMVALAVVLRRLRPGLASGGEPATPDDTRPVRLVHLTTIPETLHFFRGQISFMKAAGFEVEAISSPSPELAGFGEEQQIRTWGLAMSRRISPLRDLVALFRLVVLLRRRRPTLLHAHTPKAGLLGILAGTLARTPVRIYHLHGLPLETSRGVRRWLLWMSDRVACALAHRVLAVSPSLLAAAVGHGLVSPKKASVPAGGSINGVDAQKSFSPEAHREAEARVRARYGIAPGAPIVGFVGRVVRDKGIVELAEAWQVVRARYGEAKLLIIGPLEETDPVPQHTLALLQSDPRVKLVGLVSDVAPVMSAMTLLVLPTYREGLGTVLLEAAALGLPAVATRTTGCVDAVVDGETGLLVPPRDSAALASAICAYLDSETLRATHGAAAREHVLRNFAQDVVWKAIAAEYEAALRQQHLLERAPRQQRASAALPHGR